MRFVLPHSREQRPAWMIRIGLFLYDHLGGCRRLPGCRSLDLKNAAEGKALKNDFRRAFEYSDCWVDDSRLVVLNAVDAAERGATILTRTPLVRAVREKEFWRVTLGDLDTGDESSLRARCIVNAAGPWVGSVLGDRLGVSSSKRVRLVRGSHLVTPKLYEGDHAYLIQNHDRRVIFVNPYEDHFNLIGTTDIPQQEGPDNVETTSDEVDYLCQIVNRYFKRQLHPEDIVQRLAGVRPLYDDNRENPSAVTRDYVFDIVGGDGRAPVLSVFAGKITTHRKLAEHALKELRTFFPAMRPDWTRHAPLPGGDLPGANFDSFHTTFEAEHPWLPKGLGYHYARLYGSRARKLIGRAKSVADLGEHFGDKLYEREVAHLLESEWAKTPEDILWRRTKFGLHMRPSEMDRLADWLNGSGRRPCRTA
jgi:glycerol-3-phosphate dehydrogenase